MRPHAIELQPLDDDELMARVQGSDPAAFRELYERHAAGALQTAQSVGADRAHDAVQDGFISVWRSRANYRPGIGSVESWILTIVRRRALDLVRFESRRHHGGSEEKLESLEAPDCLEDDTIARSEGAALRAALQRLTDIQREVIVLAYFGGLTHKQIAERLELPEGTVKGRMRLGLEKLRGDEISADG